MKRLQPYRIVKNAFNADQCNELMEDMSLVQLHEASVGFEEVITDHNIRKTSVIAVPEYSWVCGLIEAYGKVANESEGWNFHLTGRDVIQYGEYRLGGHYEWHMDVDPFFPIDGLHRKITVVAMLSKRETYTGGEFEFRMGELDMDQGDVLIFPSFLEHRVKPVTSGVRRSMVCWMKGPQFT